MTLIENDSPKAQYSGPFIKGQLLPLTFPYIAKTDVKMLIDGVPAELNKEFEIITEVSAEHPVAYPNSVYIKNALPNAKQITIYRSTPLDQQAPFPQMSKFRSERIEQALDKLTMQQQEQEEQLSRCIIAPITLETFNGQLPAPAADQALKWNTEGTELENYDIIGEQEAFETEVNTKFEEQSTAIENRIGQFEEETNTQFSEFRNEINENLEAVLNAAAQLEKLDTAVQSTENAAAKANQSALSAQNSAQSAQDSYNDFKESVDGAITTIDTKSSETIASINNIKIDTITDIEVLAEGEKEEISSLADEIKDNVEDIINRVGYSMFDTVLKDHVLTYEESRGLALQGTWIYHDAIAGERYGYPDFYAKCLEEYHNATNKQVYLKSNITKIGSVVDTNGILSNLGSGKYAKSDVTINLGDASSWEIVTKHNITSVGSHNDGFMGILGGAYNVNYYLNEANKITIELSSNGTSYNIGAISMLQAVPLSTDFYIKAEFTGSAYNLYYGTSIENLELQGSITSSTRVGSRSNNFALGVDESEHHTSWVGTIDLKGCYININGEQYWSGIDTVHKNPNGHIFYDISIKDQIDKIFNSTGMAWMYGIDQENERVFLPRNVWFEQMSMDDVGEAIEAGLPNITGNYNLNTSDVAGASANGALKADKTVAAYSGTNRNTTVTNGFSFDASQSNSIYGKSNTVQPNAVKKLLYICVGNTVSDTSWVDVVTQVEDGVKDLEDKTQEGIERLKQSSTALTQTQITNCTTAITEKIKIEVDNGTLTLKAGSVVIEPQSDGSFLHRVVPEDTSLDVSVVSPYYSNLYSVCYNFELRKLQCGGINMLQTDSGDTFTSPDRYCLWYDTLNNEVKYTSDGGVTYEKGYSLPCCTANLVQGTGFTKTNEVFNGFGYIANHIYVDIGVETLIPNGRDVKRLAKNITHQTTNVRVYSRKLTGVYPLWLTRTGQLFISAGISYNANLNLVTNISNEKEIHYNCQVGIVTLSDGKVSKLEIFPPFQALDNRVPHIVEVYTRNYGGYIVYSNGWCKQWGLQNGSGVYGAVKVTLLKKYRDALYLIYGTKINWNATDNSWYTASTAAPGGAVVDIMGTPTGYGVKDTTNAYFYLPSFSNHTWITEGFLEEGEY